MRQGRAARPGASQEVGRVLCVGTDPDLRADLLAACAEAGAVADAVPHRPASQAWAGAALVLVGSAEAHLVQDLPRRDGVVLVHHEPRGGDDDPGAEVWRAAVQAGAQQVLVLPLARDWLVEAARRAARPKGSCVAVVGARGGAGATTTAVALATAGAVAGLRVLLVDADPLGGGLDLAVGAEQLPGLRWADLADVAGPLPPGGLGAALPVADGVTVLSHGRDALRVAPASARAVLRAGADEHDLVVLDLPRAGDPAAQVAVEAADVLLCVCPAEVRAAAAVPAVLTGWPGPHRTHLLVRGPSPGGLRPRDAARAVETGLLAVGAAGGGTDARARRVERVDVVRAEPGLAGALERGEPFAVAARSPLRRWAAGWVEAHLPVDARAAA
ncbi:septum site-determining protein Ssd [Jannaschia sp. R86511]|uniref:septum site-determining protein Ssd n=1 Tax=Jannaschia sp. R86511 TaxID=3093853 RepID=UPI0036D21491